MNKRSVWIFGFGLLIGVLAGYLLSNRLRPTSAQSQPAGAKADQVLAKIDLGRAVGWAGEGKWTLVPIPSDSVKQTHSVVSTPKGEESVSTSHQFVIRCDLPELTTDQEQAFFNRLCNMLREEIGRHAVTTSGGSIGMVPLFAAKPGRYYCSVIHFHTTPEHPHPEARGGLRGTATVWLTSDGKAASALVTITEMTRPDG